MQDFLLFDGGPFLERWSLGRRIAIAVLITWVPLVALAAIQGRALGPSPQESVLMDVATYARFLVTLPLLILTPAVVRPRLRMIVQHLLEAGLVKHSEREGFLATMVSTIRLRDSRVAALVLLAFAYASAVSFGILIGAQLPASWRTVGAEGNRSLSAAGWWLLTVSHPAYVFLLLQFLYRVALWWRFLWMTSRLDLQLHAAHPDGAGGLACLGMALPPFGVPAFAIGSLMAGGLADLVMWAGVSILAHTYVIGAFVIVVVAVFTGPLLFFLGKLGETKQRGMLSYGALSGDQLRQFEQKWLRTRSREDDSLGATDFSAVIDLTATVSGVHRMRAFPFELTELLPLAVGALVPFVLVAGLEIPLKDILVQLLKMVM